ncbi:hypothetical protein R8510_05123 [Ralstonia chuxiongensis]|nr:hypothetical protein R8510_05123 [Ralstonia chuxiongensis]
MHHYAYHRAKDVFVRPYVRIRFGKLENVRQHWRSSPFVLTFN